MKLKRDISKFNLLFLSISSIIGSGWLFGSYYTAQVAGPCAIFSWFLGGVFIVFIALSLAELSTMLPLSGGSVVYATLSHGKFSGTLFAWITWLWCMAVAPIEVQAIMQYSAHFISHVFYPETNKFTLKGFSIATFLMILLTFTNIMGVKLMAETNKLISLWKIAVPVIISLILIFYHPHYENLTSHQFAPFGLDGLFSSISTGGVALSFFGFQTGIFLAGEAKNPQKSIPFALFGSLFLCVLVYSLLQIGFIVGLNPTALSNGWAHLSFVNDSGPFAGILLSLGLIFIAKLLYLDAVISPFGTGLSYVAGASRILYSIGIQNEAPSFVTKLNKNSIPWVSILINFFFGMMFFMPFSDWEEMASFLSAAIVVSLISGPISLPIFRNKLPEIKRPFNLPYNAFLSFLGFYLCTLIFYWTGFKTMTKFDIALVFVMGIFLFMYILKPNLRVKKYNFKSSAWFFIYLFFCEVISYLGKFGGGLNILNDAESLIALLILCFIVKIIAEKTSLPQIEMKIVLNQMLEGHSEK